MKAKYIFVPKDFELLHLQTLVNEYIIWKYLRKMK